MARGVARRVREAMLVRDVACERRGACARRKTLRVQDHGRVREAVLVRDVVHDSIE